MNICFSSALDKTLHPHPPRGSVDMQKNNVTGISSDIVEMLRVPCRLVPVDGGAPQQDWFDTITMAYDGQNATEVQRPHVFPYEFSMSGALDRARRKPYVAVCPSEASQDAEES